MQIFALRDAGVHLQMETFDCCVEDTHHLRFTRVLGWSVQSLGLWTQTCPLQLVHNRNVSCCAFPSTLCDDFFVQILTCRWLGRLLLALYYYVQLFNKYIERFAFTQSLNGKEKACTPWCPRKARNAGTCCSRWKFVGLVGGCKTMNVLWWLLYFLQKIDRYLSHKWAIVSTNQNMKSPRRNPGGWHLLNKCSVLWFFRSRSSTRLYHWRGQHLLESTSEVLPAVFSTLYFQHRCWCWPDQWCC